MVLRVRRRPFRVLRDCEGVDPLHLVLKLAAVLLLTWLVFLVALVLMRPRGVDLAETRRLVPDVIRLVRELAKDRSLGRGDHLKLLLLVAYLASPLDLVPDFVPVLGYADDVIIVAAVLRSVFRHAGPASLEQHWRGTPQGLSVVRRLSGMK
jgi:uncharacterized membrane protein YkvA (DUF1232 family)